MRTWSKYQQAVFDNVATGKGHTVIKAVAGSGKTTTIVEALGHIPWGCKTLFVAFNKSIAEELSKRAPYGVEVSTLHSYGLKTITSKLGRLRIDARRVDDFTRAMHGDEGKTFDLRRDLAKTVSLAKGSLACEEEQIDAIIDTYNIESAHNGARDEFIQDVMKLLLQCANTDDGRIDFDDMIWLPIVGEMRQRQFDRVFVDETQDLNPAQIEMTMRAVKSGGRICAVGDPRQAIYGFRGADSAAVDNIVSRLSATVLPLSVCYRCAKAVVREAQQVVPEIEWAPDAEEGYVIENATKTEMVRDARPGDFILSRTNAPLVSLCMRFLKDGRRANIQGRDVGSSLAAFVKKSKAKTIEQLRDYVESWRDKECDRLSKKRRDTQAVEDRADCILALSEDAGTVQDVISEIESLFADNDDKNRITLSTTHKAKGLERERAWVLAGTYMKRPEEEERNLYYVAVTRAKKTLFLVG